MFKKKEKIFCKIFNVVHTARLGEWLCLVQCLSGGGVLWCWLILVVVVSEILVKTVALPSHGWGGQPSVGIRCQTELESWSGGIGSHVGVDHVGKGDYQSTPLHWQELSRDYQGMSRDYQSTPLQWQELLRDYRGLSRDYQSHTNYISRNLKCKLCHYEMWGVLHIICHCVLVSLRGALEDGGR